MNNVVNLIWTAHK